MIPNQKDIVRKGYNLGSYAYRPDDAPDDHGPYAEWVELLASLVSAGAPVVDLGCGCGLPATKLLARHFEVTGVDLSPVQIERAERLVPRARFVCGDMSSVDFEDASLAAVVSFYAIIHLPLDEHPALFERIFRWLRPGGYLLAIVGYEAWSGVEEYDGVEGAEMAWSHADEATNVAWIEQAGFELLEVRFVPEDDSGHSLVLARRPNGAAPS